ncbi:MAG: class IV adenylate cyclase [Rubrivivax sp.]|nr:class IV adenylate cyclase [Rubrivivax sp.]
MPRNIEIKARLTTLTEVATRAAALATAGPTPLVQDDSFFHCAQGRLKLREFADGSAELIAYQRPDQAGPKTSTYVRTPVADAAGLRAALVAACGLLGRVQKERTLYLVGRTRIHLDRVAGLGDFMELEVVLAEGEAVDTGIAEAQRLMVALGVAPEALEEGAYLDLLAARAQAGARPGG